MSNSFLVLSYSVVHMFLILTLKFLGVATRQNNVIYCFCASEHFVKMFIPVNFWMDLRNARHHPGPPSPPLSSLPVITARSVLSLSFF